MKETKFRELNFTNTIFGKNRERDIELMQILESNIVKAELDLYKFETKTLNTSRPNTSPITCHFRPVAVSEESSETLPVCYICGGIN